MPGTGLYSVKAAPTKLDRTQSGPPVGQVITMTVGGLGTAAAYAGGYVENVTRGEERAIVSHVDDAATLEGNLGNWLDADDLDVYDSWGAIQGAHDQLVIDQGVAAFTAEQEVRIHAGTYTEYVTIDHTLEPQARYRLVFKAAAGDSPVWSCQGLAGVMTTAGVLYFVTFDGLIFAGTSTGNYPINLHYSSLNFEFRNCTFTLTPTGTSVMKYTYGNLFFVDCELDGSGGGGADNFIHGFDSNRANYIRCHIHDYAILSPVGGVGILMESCTVHDVVDVFYCNSSGSLTLLNNTFYNITGSVVNEQVGRGHIVMLNNIFDTILAVVEEVVDPDDAFNMPHVVIDGNCYHDVTKWYDSVAESDVTTFAAWQALGYDANGINADPLLVDAASDDFTLEAGSPCRRAGVGSNAKTGIDGIAFDRHYPDIGAHSMTETITSPTWPGSLPQTVAQAQFQEGFADVVERSDMDSGPAKIRRRFTGGIQPFSATMTLTVAQTDTLQTFHDDTLAGGSLSFQWTHPRTAATVEMRFTGAPTLTQRGPAHFVAALSLEMLP